MKDKTMSREELLLSKDKFLIWKRLREPVEEGEQPLAK